jgi:hypothetical protein
MKKMQMDSKVEGAGTFEILNVELIVQKALLSVSERRIAACSSFCV